MVWVSHSYALVEELEVFLQRRKNEKQVDCVDKKKNEDPATCCGSKELLHAGGAETRSTSP